MFIRAILLCLGALAWFSHGVPLNINLGAFSPALVVGDGAISFAGQQGAGVASPPAATPTTPATPPGGGEAPGAAGAAGAAGAGGAPAAEAVPAPAAGPVATPPQDTGMLQGMGKHLLPNVRS